MRKLIECSILVLALAFLCAEGKPANNQIKPNATSTSKKPSTKHDLHLTVKPTAKNGIKTAGKSAAVQPKSVKVAAKPTVKGGAKAAAKPAARSAPKAAVKQPAKTAAKPPAKAVANTAAKQPVKSPAKMPVKSGTKPPLVQKAERSGKVGARSKNRKKAEVVAIIVEYDVPFRRGKKSKSRSSTMEASSTASLTDTSSNTLPPLEPSTKITTAKEQLPVAAVLESIKLKQMSNLEATPAPGTSKNPLVASTTGDIFTPTNAGNRNSKEQSSTTVVWDPWWVPPEELVEKTTRNLYYAPETDLKKMISEIDQERETTTMGAERDAFGALDIGEMVGGFLGGFRGEVTPEEMEKEELLKTTAQFLTPPPDEKEKLTGMDAGDMFMGFLQGYANTNAELKNLEESRAADSI